MKVGELIAKLDKYPNAWEVEGAILTDRIKDVKKCVIAAVAYPYTGNKVYITLKSLEDE